MIEIPAFGLGTYYTKGSRADGPNRGPMRDLFYLAKNNRPKPGTACPLHTWHPSGAPRYLTTPDAAYGYIAEAYAAHRDEVLRALGLATTQVVLVPVPSSSVVQADMQTARWPARDLAAVLERQGFARVLICVVNKHPRQPQHERHEPAHVIAPQLQALGGIPPGWAPLYVDDSITWGDTLAATDAVLAPPERRAALVLAFTDATSGLDCFAPRRRIVRYETTPEPWPITVANE